MLGTTGPMTETTPATREPPAELGETATVPITTMELDGVATQQGTLIKTSLPLLRTTMEEDGVVEPEREPHILQLLTLGESCVVVVHQSHHWHAGLTQYWRQNVLLGSNGTGVEGKRGFFSLIRN